jgi:hypothetical protein
LTTASILKSTKVTEANTRTIAAVMARLLKMKVLLM